MKRLLVLALILAGAAALYGQAGPAPEGPASEPPAAPNPFAGLNLSVLIPDLAIIVTPKEAANTWSGPVILEVDGRPVAKFDLPVGSAPISHEKWWVKPAWAGGGAAVALLLAAALGAFR